MSNIKTIIFVQILHKRYYIEPITFQIQLFNCLINEGIIIKGNPCLHIKIRNENEHWGKTIVILIIAGLFMSIVAGTRDAIGKFGGGEGRLFEVLCILAFIIGLAAFITKLFSTNVVFQYGSYILMSIIIIKVTLVEVRRIFLLS